MSKLQRNKRAAEQADEQEGKKLRKDNAIEVLLNPDILEVVFKYLDFTRLKLCRPVCKIWNEEICRGLRSRSLSSVVQTENDFSSFKTLMENRREHQELAQLIQSLSIHVENEHMLDQALSLPLPIAKLYVNENMDCHHSATGRKLHTLLQHSSSTLRSITIPFCNISAPESGGASPDLEFPALEELTLAVSDQNLAQDHKQPSRRRNIRYAESAEKLYGALAFFSKMVSCSAPKLCRREVLIYSGPMEQVFEMLSPQKITSLKFWTPCSIFRDCQLRRRFDFESLKSLCLSSRASREAGGDCSITQHLWALGRGVSESVESVSTDEQPYMLALFQFCPNIQRLSIRNFHLPSWATRCFGNVQLNTVRIHKIICTDSETAPLVRTCPESVRRIEIGFGQDLLEVSESLLSIYRLFTPTAKAWELPYNYVEHFCDFIVTERAGNGFESLTVGFERPRSSLVPDWHLLAKGLEKTVNLHDLKELTLKRSGSEFSSAWWNSLSPEIFQKLQTFTFYSNNGFAELPELVIKLRLVSNVVLVGAGRVRFDAKVEETLAALPNATVRYE